MNGFHNIPEKELLALLKSDDRNAFEAIYRSCVSDLFRFLRKNIDNKEDCEEIVQDIFEGLWRRRAELEIHYSLRAYLIGVARHKVLHYFRKNSLARKYREHFLLFEALYDTVEDPDTNYKAIQETLDRLINELPERCREALRLRLSEDLSNRDIAHRMKISTRTVETYMFRAFNHIRDAYRLSGS